MLVVLAIMLGIIPAIIAKFKGRSFFIWWVYGSLIFIIALPHSIFAPVLKRCPQCKESAMRDASICPHCQSEFPASGQ